MFRIVYVYQPIEENGPAVLSPVTVSELSDLQMLVDGYIEAVELIPGVTTWVNEEGLLMRLPKHLRNAHTGLPIAGPVLFDGGINEHGETLQITEKQLAAVRRYVERHAL